jgi:hypothetical protein
MAARTYSTDEVIAMMQAPREDVQMLEKPASPFLDPAQINAAEREMSQPDPSIPRPESLGGAISDAAGLEQQPEGSSGNAALQNYSASQAFPVDRTPAPQRPAGGSSLLYPGEEETRPQLPKPVYSTDEVMALYTNESQPVYSTQDVMKQMIAPLYDPTAKRPTRDEYFKLKEMEKSLKESGDIEDPGAFEIGLKAVGGVLVTAADALATAAFKVDPKDGLFTVGGIGVNPVKAMDNTLKQKDATVRLAGEYVKQQYNALSQGLAAIGGPKFRVKETGEFITSMQQAMDASKMGQVGGLAGVPAADDSALIDRYKQQGLTLVPVGDEDLKDWEYIQWNQKMDRDLSIHQAANTPRPPDVLYRLAAGIKPSITDYFTGRNDYADAVAPVLANESQANLLSMGIDPMVWATSGAGATTRLGISAAAKGATAETLGIMGKLAQKTVKPTEAALTRTEAFKRLVVSPAKVASAYGAAQGVAWAADKLELPSELKTAAFTAASLYGAYKAGVGVLRFTANKLPEASVILRESANATNGFDKAARQAVAANADVPYSIRERLIRPSQFVAMESTPARLAKNMELSPGTRAMMDKLSNWYVVQGVRGASAVATGAVKGTAASIPFAELMRSAGDEDSADAIYGMGAGFGAAGGAASRVMGARGRRYAQAESDIARFLTDVQGNTTGLKDVKRYNWIDTEIGRLLTDVELGAGDVSALVKNRSFDELARTAAMQGFFRDRVDFVPLNAADFALNAKGHGADGSAGYFLNAPEGERPRIFVNVEARRADVEPHEFYEAFFSSDAFSPEQKASMRASVDQRYGADGLMARGREYAEQLIKAENSKNFPNENLVVTGDQIAIKMEQLAQDELGRGGQDALDWVRREVMVEEARLAGIDYAALRRNVPAGQNPITFIENLLGANARALGLAGVRIDPETGMAVTPEQLFEENPVAANDPKLVKQLNGYLKTYKQWLNDPQHEAPKGTRIAPDGRAESLANNPNVAFYDGINGKENSIAFIDASGRVVEKTTKQRAKERNLRGQQIRNMVGSKILEPANPTFGLKRWADGRVRAGGKRLPDTMALQTHWKAHLPVIRSIEALSDAGESQQVRYFAKGNSVDKIKSARPGDIDAINREMVFDQWTTNAAGDLLAQFLDLTSVRNRAMKAIAERHPALDPANGGPGYKLQAIMDDVNQWMADKGAGKAGEATIGVPRKNVVNALINPGTNFNRGRNDLAGAFGRGSAIKTLLLEGINAVSGTGRKGAAMDYNWANGNFMPDKPAPRPDMDSDVQAPRGMANRRATPQMMADSADDGAKAPALPTGQQTMIQQDPAGRYEPLGMLRKAANGKWQVFTSPMMSVDKDGRQVVLPPTKVAEYATEAQARTRAEKEFFTGLPLQDAKQYLPARERQAITDAQKRIAEVAKNNPEAARLEVTRDERGLPKVGLIEDADGNPVLDDRGNQRFGAIYKGEKYGLREAPGLSKDEARAVQQAADLMEADARRGQQNPAIAKGIGWYGRMRSWLQNAYGATIERFGQLLGATSARTPVDMNFIQAREALQLFGRGAYDDLLQRFDAFVMQKKADADSGKMEADWRKRGGKGTFKLEEEYRKQVNSFKEVPLRANGKKYNANSTKVLHALYGNWIAQTKGPKTPNFAGNLTGRTFKATIDVWAARNLRRLLYQGKKSRWRILPEQEQGVTDADFFFSQKVYDEVGRRMGVATDDLQALQWFNEKDIWETNGWTDKTGAEKSSFDKEAGKLNVDRYQVGLTTFTTPEQFDPAVQRSEMNTFRESVRGLDGLEAARITESEGLYGDVVEPSFDVEFSVNRRGDVSPSIEPVMRSAIETAQRNNQKDVIISLVVDELHPNARPMVEVGFKSAATKAQVDAVTAAFRANGIDGFTIARNERGDALGVRSQYVPEISARYDTLDHLNPDQFAINSGQWVDKARKAIANLENQDNVSYRKEGYVSTAVYGIEEYTTATPADLRGSNAKQELGRRRAILAAGTR